MQNIFFKSPDPAYEGCHGGSLFIEGDTVFACWYIYPEKENVEGKIVLAKSEDKGASFSKPKILFPEFTKSQGNPCLFKHGENLVLLFVVISERYWNDGVIYYSTSNDRGEVWSEPMLLSGQKGLLVRHPPTKIAGQFYLPLYDEKEMSSHIYKLDPVALKISKVHSYEGHLIQPQIVERSDAVEIYFRTTGEDFSIWKSLAAKDLSDWGAPKKISLKCPKSGIASLNVADETVMFFNNSEGIKRTPLSATTRRFNRNLSTFEVSNVWDIDTSNLELSYPHAVNQNASTHLIYTYNRRMMKYMIINHVSKHFSFTSEVESLKNIHEGKNLFILASGPSLKEHDLSPLARRLTMGLNRSFLLYNETKYHCTMDNRLFEEYEKEHERVRVLFSLPNCSMGNRLKLLGTEGFSSDITEGIYSGYTISYFALQVAVYLGFKRVFYLGLDLCHNQGNTHFFGHDFRSENHENGEFSKMEKMLKEGVEKANELGVEVYNCSPISKFEGMPKITFEKALEY